MSNKEIIATATSNVSNGRSSTSNLTYSSGKSREDLVPGNTYNITATYTENDHYKQNVGTGVLEMLKCNTTTILQGVSSVYVGSSMDLVISVRERQHNSYLSRGYVTVYDGNNIIQQNYTITGTTTRISFSPSVTGTHTIHAVFTDSGVEYNSSNSNTLEVNVLKLPSTINQGFSLIMTRVETSHTLNGSLSVPNGVVSNQTIKLINYNGTVLQTTTTNSNGEFTLTYTPQNMDDNGHYITILYEGTNTQESASKKIDISLSSPTSISCRDSINYHEYSTKNVSGSLLDFANEGVPAQTISVKENSSEISTVTTNNNGVFSYNYPVSNSNTYVDNLNFYFNAAQSYETSNRDLKVDIHYEEVHFTKMLFVQTSTSPSTYSLIPVDDTTYQRYKKGNMTVQEVLSQLNDTVIAPSFYDTTSQTTTKSKTLGNPSNTSYLCYCIDDNNIFNSFLCELHIEPSTHEVYDMTWYYGTEAVKRLHSKYSISKSSISSIWNSNNWAVYEKQAGESKTNPVFDPTVTKYYDICDADNWDYWVYKDSGNESQSDRCPTFCKNSHEADLGVRYRVVWQIPIQSDGSKDYHFKLYDVGKYTRMGIIRRNGSSWSMAYTRRHELGLENVNGEHSYRIYVNDGKILISSEGQSAEIVSSINSSYTYYFVLYAIAEGVKLTEFYEVSHSGTLQLGKRYIHRLNNLPLDPNKTYRVTLSSSSRYVYIAVTRDNGDGTFYVNDGWRRSFVSFDMEITEIPTFEVYLSGTTWTVRCNGKSLSSLGGYSSENDYYLYLYSTVEDTIVHSIIEEVGHNNVVEDLHANISLSGSTSSVANVNANILTEYDNDIDDGETVRLEFAGTGSNLTTSNGNVSNSFNIASNSTGPFLLRATHSGNSKYNSSVMDKYIKKTSLTINNHIYRYTNREYGKLTATVTSTENVNKGNVDWIISNNTIDTTPVIVGNSYTSAIKSSEFNTTGEYSLTLNYYEDKEYLPSTASSTIVVDSFSSTQLTDWTWAGWDETSINSNSQRDASMVEKTYTSPVTGVSETVDTCMTGKGKLVVLTHPIPVDKDYFQLSVIIKSGGSNNRVFIGNYESSNGNYVLSSDTLRVKCSDVGINDTSDTFYQMLFTFTNGICVASGPNSTTVSKDFTNYNGDFYLMFYSAGIGTQFVSTVDWKYEI